MASQGENTVDAEPLHTQVDNHGCPDTSILQDLEEFHLFQRLLQSLEACFQLAQSAPHPRGFPILIAPQSRKLCDFLGLFQLACAFTQP